MTTPLKHPLGRLVQHDPLSRRFTAPRAANLRSVNHTHYGPVLDQGQVGSCTGNALAQALNTKPLHTPRGPLLDEQTALALYTAATTLDDLPGTYPAQDTGSSGIAVCKAGVQQGLITSYTHAFGLEQCLLALVVQPVMIGTTWTDSMFTPDKAGFVHPNGNPVGGHEYALTALNARLGYVVAYNSWSDQWGNKGRFKLTFADLDTLLKDQGDVTAPHR